MAVSKEPIRLIIADNHKMLVEAKEHILGRVETIEIADTCNDSDRLLELIYQLHPDVVLMDISMPGLGPKAIAQKVTHLPNPPKLIAVTMHLEPHLCDTLMECGFAGYVVKDDAFAELLQAIDAVLAGEIYLSKSMRELKAVETDPHMKLSPREVECLTTAAGGKTNNAIAKELNISLRTVKYHFENILKKLNASNRTEAIAIARKNHLISTQDTLPKS